MTFKYRFAVGFIFCYLVPGPCPCLAQNIVNEGKFSDKVEVVGIEKFSRPVFINSSENIVVSAVIKCNNTGARAKLVEVSLLFSGQSEVSAISEINIICGTAGADATEIATQFRTTVAGKRVYLTGSYTFSEGQNNIGLSVLLKKNTALTGKLKIEELKMRFDDGTEIPAPLTGFPELRFALKLRSAGQDNCDTYRIPGIITTSKGTLIAVYDNRYNSSKDLQEDIDIGMSRSTDGGESWEPMKVIMDMGTYGGLPQNQNGMGDPCILYDTHNGVIWVASLWMPGVQPDKMIWWVSKPGMAPEVTGQFMVVKSSDDGLTWSKPENLTQQIKWPEWQLLLQGPGRGITMNDGTLVFPAQFKADIGTKAIDGGQYTCHSTIVYSCDGGSTWEIGTGAKSNTTESQVVELSDGTLMLNMRDDRNRSDKGETNGRAVSTTKDLGKSWVTHVTSNSTLPEPNCQASLITADLCLSGTVKKVVFFSNPANRIKRAGMTIKASLDEGTTWPGQYQLLINEDEGYGYSCMTMINDKYIGILYEGNKELYFQKIPVKDLLKSEEK